MEGSAFDEPLISGNRQAEMALVYLAMTADDLVPELFQRVEVRDFMYDDCRFIFAELVAMREAGQPISDKAALGSWFKRNEVAHRMKKEKLEWFQDGKPFAFSAILEIVLGGEFASMAHLDWYILEVRRMRVIRGFRLLSWDLGQAVDKDEPLKVLEWLEEKIGQIRAVAAPLIDKAKVEECDTATS